MADEPTAGAMTYGQLSRCHPTHDPKLWAELRALHDGGPRLLRDKALMARVFPSHLYERPEIYAERVKRAHYFSYAGMVCGWLAGGLSSDPLKVTADGAERDSADLPAWWAEWIEDVSAPAAECCSLADFATVAVREAMQTQCAWVLVDIPPAPEGDEIQSLADQERLGLLDPHLTLWPAEQVIDWEVDGDNELLWVLTCTEERRRLSLADDRGTIVKTWQESRRDGWSRWQVAYREDKPPADDDVIPMVAQGSWAHGRVPFVTMELPAGLWAMGQLESPARELFNKSNAGSWAEYKSLFAVLYEFLGVPGGGIPEMTADGMPADAMDPNRATGQVRGQGYTQVRGAGDDARYVGPDVAPFSEARISCDRVMREMFRTLGVMALSVNMDSAALMRSAESKGQDMRSLDVVLGAYGRLVRQWTGRVLDMVEIVSGRPAELEVGGMASFAMEDLAATLESAVKALVGLPQRSPAFTREALYRAYKAVLQLLSAENVDPAILADIRNELATAVTAEGLEMSDATPTGDDPKEQEGQDEPRE